MILHACEALTPGGWVRDVGLRIDAGRIVDVGPVKTLGESPPDHRVDLLLPAPVNLHSHAFQRAMSGLTEARGPDPADSFWTWRRLMYRFLDRLTPDDVETIAALVFMEMLESGFGAVAEFHYLHHGPDGVPYAALAEMSDRIVAAADITGIGLTLLPVLYQHGGCDGRALQGGQRRFGNDPERFARLHEAVSAHAGGDRRTGVAPHSLRAVDDVGLAAAQSLAGTGPLHLHLAEQVAEVDEVVAHRGARPVEWLLANAAVDAQWCLIHCTQMTPSETGALAATGAVAGLCPITESSLGDGIFNGVAWAGSDGAFGVGSDSNVQVGLFDELRTLEYSQRLRDQSRAALATARHSTGRVLFDAACAGGAQAAGRESGAIAPGMWADLVGLRTDTEVVCGRRGDTALDTLIFAGQGGRAVTDVWSAGGHMVKAGRHVARGAIVARYLATMQRLGQDL